MTASMPNPFRTGDLNPKKQTSGFKYIEKAIPLVTFNQNKQGKIFRHSRFYRLIIF